MSISGALANAVSGLTAASRSAQVVSTNVANANTEGYGRREIQLTTQTGNIGSGGVRVAGIERSVDAGTIADRRLADADLGYSEQKAAFFTRLESTIGTPDSAGSLTGQMARFEASLVAASAAPDNRGRLAEILQSATSLAAKLTSISDTVQVERQNADAQIGRSVDQLNASLENIAGLNDKISTAQSNGQDVSGLMDQRQVEIDRISDLVPLRTVPRDRGQIALITSNGTTLLDGKAAELNFTRNATITADMTLTSGRLSDIEITGAGSLVGTTTAALAGGKLAAMFEIRDTGAVAVQTQIDAASRNLIEKFSDPALDPTLVGGAPGLFTDAGAAIDPTTEEGLAGRISVNSAVDAGNLWRIRDGIGAVAEGASGDNTLIENYRAALGRADLPASGNFAGARDSADLFADILSEVGFERQTAEVRAQFSGDQQSSLADIEKSAGVNTDQELQKLLLIERAYAANAKVIQAVDDMLQQLLRI